MAKISTNDDAPEGLGTISLGSTEIDVSSGSVESNDYNVVGDAQVHPFLEVEGGVDPPDAEEVTQSHVSADISQSSEGPQEVPVEVKAQAEGETARDQQRGRKN